jgi:MSHA biogenesis protein MshE
MGAPHYMVASSVHAVLAQRLVRLVCESCSEPAKPDEFEQRWLAVHAESEAKGEARFMHGRGCSHCNGTGFLGRIGVYELLEMTIDLVRASNRNDANQFTEIARRQMQGNTLGRNAFRLAAEGRTTLAEAIRIASAQED